MDFTQRNRCLKWLDMKGLWPTGGYCQAAFDQKEEIDLCGSLIQLIWIELLECGLLIDLLYEKCRYA